MLRLLTFGGLRVLRADGSATDLANQRRRIAVLAIVAAAAPHGVTRERLIDLLWPDADADKGRHALNQIVYNLRRELGASPIDGAAELSLQADVMSADLLEFRDALTRGDHAAAAALYAGPFLDGYYVPGATEFERWAEDERTRAMRQAVAAIDRLADAANRANDGAAHVAWTQRLVELDPLSAKRALAHMRALDSQGDREAAITYGRRYEALARHDGDDVDPAVQAETDRMRATPRSVPALADVRDAEREVPDAPLVPVPNDSSPAATVTVVETVATIPSVSIGAPDAIATSPPTRDVHPGRVRRWRAAAVAGAAVMAAGAALAWSRTRAAVLPMATGDRVVIADATVPTADSADARALVFALTSALRQSSRIQLVSPVSVTDALRRMGRDAQLTAMPDSTAAEVAEREGARYVISLRVMPSGESRSVTLRVLDPSSRAELRSYSAVAAPSAILAAIDRVAAGLRSDMGDSNDEIAAAMPLPRATTPSLEALRLLSGARIAYNRALYADARALYASAVALDSGFAAAHAGLASVAYVLNDVSGGDAQIRRALALADRLPPRERMLIEASAARGTNDWSHAAALHRAYLIRYPNDYDVYEALGYDLMRAHDPRESTAAFDSFMAHRPPSAATMLNVAQVSVQLGRFREARTAHAAALHLDTAFLVRVVQNEQIGATLLALGFADSARAVHSVLLARGVDDKARGHRLLAYVDLYEGRYAVAITHLRSAIDLDAANGGSGLSEVRDRALLASALIDLGSTADARDQLRKAAALCLNRRQVPQALFWTGKLLARMGDTIVVRQLLDSAAARGRASDAAEMASVAGLEAELQIARGNRSEGVEAAEKATALDSLAYLVDTRAYALERAGRLADARAMYESLTRQPRPPLETEGQQKARLAPLAIARIDIAMGRIDEARRTLGAFIERWPAADANLPMITTLRDRIDAVAQRP